MKTHWYQLSADDTLKQLDCGPAGLSSAEAQQRLAKVGPNELVEKGGRTRKEIIVEQLTGVLTILLFIAALISAVLGDWIEAVVIMIIVVLNAVPVSYTHLDVYKRQVGAFLEKCSAAPAHGVVVGRDAGRRRA